MSIVQQLRSELWLGSDPFEYADESKYDPNYPHTNLTAEFAAAIIQHTKPRFWLEIGGLC